MKWSEGFRRWQVGIFIGRRHFGIGWARAAPWLDGSPMSIFDHNEQIGGVAIFNVPGGRYRVGAFWLDADAP